MGNPTTAEWKGKEGEAGTKVTAASLYLGITSSNTLANIGVLMMSGHYTSVYGFPSRSVTF